MKQIGHYIRKLGADAKEAVDKAATTIHVLLEALRSAPKALPILEPIVLTDVQLKCIKEGQFAVVYERFFNEVGDYSSMLLAS